MPRRNRRRTAPARSSSVAGILAGMSDVDWDGERWRVVVITGSGARKEYRCPGCDQIIRIGQPHVAVWLDEGDGQDRRHWHNGCWAARERRGPLTRRPRGPAGRRP